MGQFLRWLFGRTNWEEDQQLRIDSLVATCMRSRQPIRQDVRIAGGPVNETWRVTVELLP